ncbi:hypothetical protein LINPERHAP1_LOCUS4094, partial [Linum perenne]
MDIQVGLGWGHCPGCNCFHGRKRGGIGRGFGDGVRRGVGDGVGRGVGDGVGRGVRDGFGECNSLIARFHCGGFEISPNMDDNGKIS